MSMRRGLAWLSMAAVLTSCAVSASAGDGNPPPNPKWFVCKFTGTPGVDEVLQGGQNPISVSENAIPISPVFVGAEFTDAQGRSLVIAEDVGQPEPPASSCVPQGGTTTTSTTTTPSTSTTTTSTTSTSTSTTSSTTPTTTSTSSTSTTTSSSTSTTSTSSTTSSTTTTSTVPSSTSTTTTSTSTTLPATSTSTSTTTTSSTTTSTTTLPSLTVEFLTPICDGDVPYLGYSAHFGDATTVDRITFVNPAGDDFTYTNLPLVGRVLWPGAVVDANGAPLDWPGWTEVAPDVWVEGDEWDWVRPSVLVELEINPTQTATIGYPPATPTCDANPPPPPGVTTTTTIPGSPPVLPPTR